MPAAMTSGRCGSQATCRVPHQSARPTQEGEVQTEVVYSLSRNAPLFHGEWKSSNNVRDVTSLGRPHAPAMGRETKDLVNV